MKKHKRGVIVACDEKQEWLLPWWGFHYETSKSSLPITFFDLGMSKEGKSFCEKMGTLVSFTDFPMDFLTPNRKISKEDQNALSKMRPDWKKSSRKEWFQKPFICLHSPYDETIWIDVDCQILSPIEELFTFLNNPARLAIAQDTVSAEQKKQGFPRLGEYNSGVLVFEPKAPLIQKWAELSRRENHLFLSDQDVLSWVLNQEKILFAELSILYNCPFQMVFSFPFLLSQVKICHWLGPVGKKMLRKYFQNSFEKVCEEVKGSDFFSLKQYLRNFSTEMIERKKKREESFEKSVNSED